MAVLLAAVALAGLASGGSPATYTLPSPLLPPPAQAATRPGPGTLGTSAVTSAGTSTGATAATRPNIVLITTDDQTAHDLRYMPKTRRLIGGAGITFDNFVSPHPLCCPARAEILTGQFAQNNGVRSNGGRFGGLQALTAPNNTIGSWMQDAGYATVFMGKYLNGYGNTTMVPAGWDSWNGAVKGVYSYYGFSLNHNGVIRDYPGAYQTDVLASMSASVIDEAAASDRPLFLWASYVAPHDACCNQGVPGFEPKHKWGPAVPPARYLGDFDDMPLWTRAKPSFNEPDVSDKPSFISRRPRWGAERIATVREEVRRRVEALQAVDDAVATTVEALRRNHELDNTLIMFTSDNGYLFGEHRYLGKVVAYEEALRVPFLMRGPGIPAGVHRRQVVTTVDIAPTALDAADATPRRVVDGRSILPVARSGSAPGWSTLLIQAGPRPEDTYPEGWLYRGVRTHRYTYLRYTHTGEEELYDRRLDPYQLRSVATDPRYAGVRKVLARQLRYRQDCSGKPCRSPLPAPPAPRVATP